jgi:hypothetical protein
LGLIPGGTLQSWKLPDHQFQPSSSRSVAESQLTPRLDILGRRWYFPLRTANKDQGILWTNRDTQAASDTIGRINNTNYSVHVQGIKLTAVQAIPTCNTEILIHNCKKICTGNRI